MSRVGRTVGALTLAVALFIAGGVGVLRHPVDLASGAAAPATAGDPAALAVAPGSAERAITQLQQRLRDVPGDWNAANGLGLAYVQEARITADPSYYPRAEAILNASLATHPHDNPGAYVGLAALAAARHDFAGALRDGERAKRLDPYDGAVYGVIGDALVELGRYDAAAAAFQTMVNTSPGLSSYARVSYLRELRGDVRGAITAMQAARDVAGTPQDTSWAAYQLGELAWNAGDVAEAAARYREASQLDPSWVPPLAGLAKVAWARGDAPRAIAGYRDVVARYPLPGYVVALGDLLATTGDREGAREQYGLAHAEAALFRANGVNVDLELALFDADHGRPGPALRAARDEWARRHSIHVADAYAWALHAAGRDREALAYERRALTLGTRSALFRYHLGMIELSLDRRAAGFDDLRAALRINPNFSILGVSVARGALARERRAA
jgi:tetratricopeptide (TPR) repeat protein